MKEISVLVTGGAGFIGSSLAELLDNQNAINVGSDAIYTINQLASLVVSIIGSTSNIMHIDPLKEGDMSRRQPENSKMKTLLGLDLLCLEDGLKLILN